MRAAVLHRAGPPSVFELADIDVPEIGDDDVLVRVEACGVSSRDIAERNGTYRRDVSYPLVMGLEISGTVVARGGRVTSLTVGDHVASKAFASCGGCRLCRNGHETTCAARRPVRGGYAELTALPADAFVKVPDSIPFVESCTLGPAAGVALNAVRDVANVRIGDTVVVTGATGGVGLPSVQLAHLAGARVMAITRRAEHRDALLEDGAHHVIVSPDGDFAPDVRELTGGSGADVVVDTVGSPVFDACFDSLAVHGRYALVGELLGEEVSINPARIFFKRAQHLGVGSVSRSQLEDVAELVAAGRLLVRVGAVLPLACVARAHEIVERSEVLGRVVITPHHDVDGGTHDG